MSDYWKGKKVLVTAGPTREAIDPVRFLSNHSSGKMGIAIADALAERGAQVILVLGPSNIQPSNNAIEIIPVISARDMYEVCMERFADMDLAIMAAAVADFTPATVAEQKMKKQSDGMTIELVRTKDILAEMGKRKQSGQMLVGFAMETENEEENAKGKLKRKNLDLIVLNSLRQPGAGFAHDTNQVKLIDREENIFTFKLKPKAEVAKDILDHIESMAKS
jgi:phosphopantothenoylcysteine decarboxylase/phosphopantothenate--cysteine ligase